MGGTPVLRVDSEKRTRPFGFAQGRLRAALYLGNGARSQKIFCETNSPVNLGICKGLSRQPAVGQVRKSAPKWEHSASGHDGACPHRKLGDYEPVIFGQHDEATIRQIETCLAAGGEKAVLCADGHKGYAQPIGGVVAYKDKVSISGVGFDIACGNLAIRTDVREDEIKPKMDAIMGDVVRHISFGVGRTNKNKVDHELFDDEAWNIHAIGQLKHMAQEQLGTVGSGNHYVDIFADENGVIWVGVHFGSRGLGHRSATHFLKIAGGKDGMDVPPTVVDLQDQIGQDYLAAMRLGGRYAYAGREYVARFVVREILKASIVEEVHNHHNFAWEEEHYSEKFWVVRKGATPAFPGQRGFRRRQHGR